MKRVLTVGGGPAGLYASLLLKKAQPDLEVTLLERNPPGATFGWGVVFSDRTLAEFREADAKTFEEITRRFVLWDAIDIHFRGEVVRSGGHVFAGIARVALLELLTRRCEELGVTLRFEEEAIPEELGDHDLVIAGDGVHSLLREHHTKTFRPTIEHGRARYIWFGTDRVLDAFTFLFRENDHGFFQAHAYPFDGTTSTFIVETDEEVWQRAGLDRADEAQSIEYCQRLFAEELRGRRLMSNRSEWTRFPTLRNRTWVHENLVLVGDAAHTAHFSIGSGTKLAMEDSIALVRALERFPGDVPRALADYELERRPVIDRFQEAARDSRTYFESTSRYRHLEPMPFAFNLLTRSGRIDYGNLRTRDPHYVDHVDREFAGGGRAVAPPPMLVPFRLRDLTLANRIASAPGPRYESTAAVPSEQLVADLAHAAEGGAAMVTTEPIAVSANGRITSGCAGLYRDEQEQAWVEAAGAVHAAGAALAMRISHAGRRGSTRPRGEGLDRPLPGHGWPLLAPSAIPFAADTNVPEEMADHDLEWVRDAFVEATSRAATAGIDLLLVHMGHGYLLGSFLSPLSNARGDTYGGGLEARMRYPLEVFEAIRGAWPENRPLGATVQASDAAAGGWTEEEAVTFARELAARGCDLIEPVVGQTVPESRPRYAPGFLIPYADRIRNMAGVATLVGGGLTTTVQVNTIIAAARADVCVLSP